jgi:HAD superfamily phosphoserine phosphatase-like hydrolase
MKLYLYDFDGTISNKDSMIAFIFFIQKKYKIIICLVTSSPYFFKYLFKVNTKSKLKEALLIKLLNEFREDELKSLSISFSKHFIKNSLRASALKSIQDAKKNKDHICIVSASLDIWMQEIANQLGLSLICTDSVFIEKKFVGLRFKNCIGKEKVKRIKSKYDLSKYNEILCFGDSSGDTEMLSIGTKSFYKFFK